jgi:predicted ATPase/DNA-binding SARP family transcriptional activator/Tfp pilus assembly protein PilF
MPQLALYLLGSPRVERDGQAVHIGRRKALALLAYLAVEGGSHRRDTLATLLWPEYDQSGARADLRRTLSLLRRVLGQEWLLADRETARLDPDADLWLDVHQFRQLLAACEAHGHPTTEVCPGCVPSLEEAVGLYHDNFMAGFTLPDSLAFDEWQFFQTQGLRDGLASALQRLVRWRSDQGEYEAAIAYARRWLALDPIHEAAHRALMALYAQAGQREAALRQYQMCERTLAEELDMPPSVETTTLYERLRSESAGPAIRQATPPPRHNLPALATPLIGRETELADLGALLNDPTVRLITLSGPGGMGKTRLALEAATRQQDAYSDGVWLVQLAPLDDGEAIPQAMASALGVPAQPGQSLQETIIDSLRLRQLLLLVDNCEHVLDGTAAMVGRILEQCPQVTILTTSRERLRLPGEHLRLVPALSLPEADAPLQRLRESAACQLFLARSREVQPGFELTQADAAAISQICRRLDGMPLAIELAAARMRAFSPQEISARLDDRFRLMTGGNRTAVPRQQTLLNTVAWSYGLLTEAEQRFFVRLSAFRGGFTLEAAEQVCGGEKVPTSTVLELLARLVDKSLVLAGETGEGNTRYHLLETLRHYGHQRLVEQGKLETIRERHAFFYVALAEEAEPELYTGKMEVWRRRLGREEDNIRATVTWLLASGRHELALRLVGASFWWWAGRHVVSEGLEWLLKGLAQAEALSLPLRAKVLWQVGFLYGRDVGEQERAQTLLEESLSLYDQLGDDGQTSWVLYVLGLAAEARGERERAGQLLQQSLALARDAGSTFVEANVLPRLARHQAPDQAEELFEQALALSRKLEWPWMIGWACLHWGIYGLRQGKLTRAKGLLEEALAQYRMINSPIDLAVAYAVFSDLAVLSGHYDRARVLLKERLAWCRYLGLPIWIADALMARGWLAWHEGSLESAKVYVIESLEIARQHSHVRRLLIESLLALAAVARDEGNYTEAEAHCQECLALAEEQGSPYWKGAVLARQGSIAHRQGDGFRAIDLYQQALHGWRDGADQILMLRSLEELAWALAGVGKYDLSTRMLGYCATGRERSGLALARPEQPHHDRAVAAVRRALREGAFDHAWAQGQSLTLEAAIDLALVAEIM